MRRQLGDDELAQSGAQKLLIDMLEQAEQEKDEYKAFVPKYYEAESRASMLNEKLNSVTAVEVLHGTVVALGGILMGQSTYANTLFWVGAALIVGAGFSKYLNYREKQSR